MDVLETALLEEFVGGVGEVVPDAHNSTDQFCARSHVRDVSQVLVGVLLLREVVRVARAFANNFDAVHFGVANLQLHKLSLRGRFNKFADHLEACACGLVRNFGKVGHSAVDNDLERRTARAIVQLDEAEVLATHAEGAGPASNLNIVVEHLLVLWCVEGCNSHAFAGGVAGHHLCLDVVLPVEVGLYEAFVAGVLGAHWFLLSILICLLGVDLLFLVSHGKI